MRVAIAALAAAALAGCSGGSVQELEKQVKGEMVRHFADLNAAAAESNRAAKETRTDIDIPATALVVNRYEWDLNGMVHENVVCQNCQESLGTMATIGVDLRCPACGAGLMEELARVGKGKPMFELKSGTATPIRVLVRYVRRMYAYDPNSAVTVSAKTAAQFPTIDAYTVADNRGKGAYYAGGFYRMTGAAIATAGFAYDGGSLRPLDRAWVKQQSGEPVEVATEGDKAQGPVEKPLLPWLGKMPAAPAPKDPPKEK